MTEALPSTDAEIVRQCQRDYIEFQNKGDQKALEEAHLRLTWALVHSPYEQHMRDGFLMSQHVLLEGSKDKNEYRYLYAVAAYKLKKYLDARRELTALLQASPQMRQAEVLKSCVEDAIIKEGLMGLGVAAGVVAAIAGTAIAIGLGRRK